MSVFTQDDNCLYIDLASLPTTDFPSLSSEIQLFDQVIKAFKTELITFNNMAFTTLDPVEMYRWINQSTVTKTVKIITIMTQLPRLDPDDTI